MLHAQGCKVDLYCGPRISELASENRFLRRYVESREPAQTYEWVANVEASDWAKELAASLCGPKGAAFGPAPIPQADTPEGRLADDENWTSPDLGQRYPSVQSGHISEIFCRICGLEGEVPLAQVTAIEPCREIPPVLISATASLPEKIWPEEKWMELLSGFNDVGLLGAKPSQQKAHMQGADLEGRLAELSQVTDLRGELSLPKVAGALASAKLLITLDNGLMHLGSAMNAPTVALFRHGIHRLWAPQRSGLEALEPGQGRQVADISVKDVAISCEKLMS